MTTMPPPTYRRRPHPRRLDLSRTLFLAATLLVSTFTVTAAELPVVSTPWDPHDIPNYVIIRLGEYEASLAVASAGSGEGDPVFSCTGLPPGLKLDKTTGLISGTVTRTGIHTITSRVAFGSLSSQPLVRRVAVLPLHLCTPGIYEATLPYEHFRPLGAHLTVHLQPSGAYSGLARLGNKNVGLAGIINPPEDDSGEGHSSTSLTLQGTEGRVFKAVLASNADNAFFVRIEDRETGDYFSHYVLHPVRPAVGYIPPCPQTGRHVVAMPAAMCIGFGSVQVGADYRLSFAGQTPDGRGVTGAHWVSPVDGSVFCQFYAANGSNTAMMGGIYLPSESPGWQSDMAWILTPQSGRRLHPEGVVEGLGFLSSRSSAAKVASTFPDGDATLQIQYTNSGDTLRVPFKFNRQMRATFGPGEENPLKARLNVYVPTGLFTGQFTLRDPDPNHPSRTIVRTMNFRGMFLPDHDQVLGSFTLPELPSDQILPRPTMATTPIVPGWVEIVPGSPN